MISDYDFEFFKKNEIKSFMLWSDDLSDVDTKSINQSGQLAIYDTGFYPEIKILLPRTEKIGIVGKSNSDIVTQLCEHIEDIKELIINFEINDLPEIVYNLASLNLLMVSTKLTTIPDLSKFPQKVSFGFSISAEQLHTIWNQNAQSKTIWMSISDDSISENSDNSMPEIPDDSISENSIPEILADLWKFVNLQWLNIRVKELTILPTEIKNLSGLTVFHLQSQKMTGLPAEFWQLVNLRSLEISSSQMSSLPAEIGQFANLTSLDLHSNHLSNLPIEIEKLTNLTSLDLSNNQLSSLPAEIGKLTNLTSLNISGNQLSSLPTEIEKLTNLTSLNISGNQLSSLPTGIEQLTNLTSLNLRDNQLSNLPTELRNLAKLKKMDIRGNKIEFPPEILDKHNDAQAIISYFTWILDGKRKQISETKMLVVGQGSVGKTSLIKRMTLETFDSQEIKTDGIAIDHWHVENRTEIENKPTEIALHLWDFGGQEIMHATHQFFLTKRSLYLLVLDSRLTQEENRVEYWLKIIQSFSDESPVLIVGNKIDQHPLDIDRTGLQKKYPNIVGILETSAATGAGIEELKAAITEQVNHLPHVRDLLPETWFTVKTKLEGLGRESNFITHDKYLELCAENEVSDETSQRTLIGFLHDLGIVLHFQDDPRLEALGILNPQWVTNGVYKILNSHELFQNKGVLPISMLNSILNIDGYPRDKRLFIVDMMKKFELCYDIEADKTFLVPDLLPKDEPAELKFNGVPAFEYAYPVLPSSVITRFIVRMNQKIDDGLVWRTGVVLKIGENKALIKADIEDRKITIAIDGQEYTRRDTLTAIFYHLNDIHDSIKGLNPEKLVPVPGAENAKPIPYNYLLMLEAKGIEILPVQDGNRLIDVNIRKVLSGVPNETQDKNRESVSNVTNIIVGGNFEGNLLVGDKNQVIQNSYNKIKSADIQPELKETMKQLAEAVDIMIQKLPAEQAAEVAEDFGKLADEAVKPKPNQKWYSVSIEGLIKAAENLDKLGEPVIDLSRKVLSLLTGGVSK